MADTKLEILEATQRALIEHGYSDLSTEKVADELGRSQSLVHYHYETKDDLLAAFVEFYSERFRGMLSTIEDRAPEERLAAFVALMAGNAAVPEVRSLNLAMYELQADAVRKPVVQEALTGYHETLTDFLVETIEEGISAGVFTDENPRRTADLLLSALDGALLQQYTLDVEAVERVAFDGLTEYVLATLYVGDVPDMRALAAEFDPEELSRRAEQESSAQAGPVSGGDGS
jgi:AcrR family transcriptional regulator